MRITINCRSILKANPTGIGRYTNNLIRHLGAIDHSNQYCLYTPKGVFDFKRQLPVFAFSNFKQELDMFNRGIKDTDIYHLPSPDKIGHVAAKLVVTVHDLIHQAYPQGHTPETIDITEKHMQQIIKRADHVICTSNSTRTDLHRFYEFPKEKSSAILNGVDHTIFYQIKDKAEAQPLLIKLGVESGFILYVGTIEPRKNIQGVLEALAILKAGKNKLPKLVVAGMRGWMMDQVHPLIKKLGLEGQVVFAGFLSDQELNMLYNTCTLFIFPSFYEGFGFPIVEAFCAGACVITSSTSSCAEIAGDAALLVDPSSKQAIASAIERVLADDGLKTMLKAKASNRAAAFSFAATAAKTLDIYYVLQASS